MTVHPSLPPSPQNRQGQLGHSNASDGLPSVVDGLAGVTIVGVSAGRQHSCAISADGALYTWGDGSLGALGHGDKKHKPVPTKVRLCVVCGSQRVVCDAQATVRDDPSP